MADNRLFVLIAAIFCFQPSSPTYNIPCHNITNEDQINVTRACGCGVSTCQNLHASSQLISYTNYTLDLSNLTSDAVKNLFDRKQKVRIGVLIENSSVDKLVIAWNDQNAVEPEGVWIYNDQTSLIIRNNPNLKQIDFLFATWFEDYESALGIIIDDNPNLEKITFPLLNVQMMFIDSIYRNPRLKNIERIGEILGLSRTPYRIQAEGEMCLGMNISNPSQLKKCKIIFGDLIISGKSNDSTKFISSIVEITGQLIIANSTIESLDFLNFKHLIITKGGSQSIFYFLGSFSEKNSRRFYEILSYSITNSEKLCVSKKLMDFKKIRYIPPLSCEPHFDDSACWVHLPNSLCSIIETEQIRINIENEEELQHLVGLKLIPNGLEIKGTTATQINLSALEKVGHQLSKRNADLVYVLSIRNNLWLKRIFLDNLKPFAKGTKLVISNNPQLEFNETWLVELESRTKLSRADGSLLYEDNFPLVISKRQFSYPQFNNEFKEKPEEANTTMIIIFGGGLFFSVLLAIAGSIAISTRVYHLEKDGITLVSAAVDSITSLSGMFGPELDYRMGSSMIEPPMEEVAPLAENSQVSQGEQKKSSAFSDKTEVEKPKKTEKTKATVQAK